MAESVNLDARRKKGRTEGGGESGWWKDIDDGHEETGRSASGMRLRLR